MNNIRVVSAASPPTLTHKTRKDGAPSVMVAQASVVRSVGQPPSPRTSFKGWATRPVTHAIISIRLNVLRRG